METFAGQIRALAQRIQKLMPNIATEEATKTSVIMPFFQILGYDVFNPEEFLPEFVADVGIKKGEKVDYAILQNGQPLILIEAKSINERLEKHDSQLFRYFGTTKAKFAILTNGLIYRFYTDLEEQNKMDSDPFFEFNITEMRDNQIAELYKFRKNDFDLDNILNTASELKYIGDITGFLSTQWENPSDEFIAFILANVYSGKKTKSVIEKFNSVVKKSLKQFVNDSVNDKLKAALNNSNTEAAATIEKSKDIVDENIQKPENEGQQIVTTEEEIEGYVTIKILLKDEINPERIFYRDNLSYFNILVDNNIRKWVCRLGLNSSNKYVQFNDENRTTINIDRISDLIEQKRKLIEVANKFI
jgi:predicted type IV restriction endonuclease